jgi:hypothetical protein
MWPKNQGNDKKNRAGRKTPRGKSFDISRSVRASAVRRTRIRKEATRSLAGIAEARPRRLPHDENKNCAARPQNRQIALCPFAAPEAGGQYAAARSTLL